MSASVGTVAVDLTANTANFETNVSRARRTLQDNGRQMQRHIADVEKETSKLGDAFGALRSGLGTIASMAGGFAGVGGAAASAATSATALGAALGALAAGAAGLTAIARAGDQATVSLQLLQSATGSIGAARDAYEGLYRIALSTGVAVSESAGAFSRFSVAAREVGATSADVLALVRTIQQAGIVSGASAQETASAVQQLGQALASGTLQGDELRSLLENMPTLAQALARQLGVGVGELRKMGAEGRLTADVVLPALLRAGEQINAEFEKLPPTMGRAFGQLGSAMSRFLGDLDSALGLSSRIAAVASGAAQRLNGLRQTVGLGTAEENARARATAAQTALSAVDAAEATSTASGRRGNSAAFQRQRQAAIAELEAANREIAIIEAEAAARRQTDQANADTQAAAARERRLDAAGATLRERYLREEAIEKTYTDAVEALRVQRERGSVTEQQADTILNRITREKADAYRALQDSATGAARAVRQVREAEQFGPGAREFQASQAAQRSAGAQLFEQTRTAEERRAANLERYNELLEAGAIEQETFNRAVAALDEPATQAGDSFARFGDIAASAFEDAIINGKSLQDVLRAVIADISKVVLRSAVTGPLSGAISSGLSSFGSTGGGGGEAQVFAEVLGAFGGAKAAGGPVDPSSWYVVGENGPEVFRPSTAGAIIPNDAMGGGGGSLTVNINSQDYDRFRQNRQQVSAVIADAVRAGSRTR